MKNRQMRLRILTGGMAAMMLLSNAAAITANACGIDEIQEVTVTTETTAESDPAETTSEDATQAETTSEDATQAETTPEDAEQAETTPEEVVQAEPTPVDATEETPVTIEATAESDPAETSSEDATQAETEPEDATQAETTPENAAQAEPGPVEATEETPVTIEATAESDPAETTPEDATQAETTSVETAEEATEETADETAEETPAAEDITEDIALAEAELAEAAPFVVAPDSLTALQVNAVSLAMLPGYDLDTLDEMLKLFPKAEDDTNDTEKSLEEEIEEEAEANVRARLEKMTLDELLEYWLTLSTAKANDYTCEDAVNTDPDRISLVKEAENKYAEKLLKTYFNNGLEIVLGTIPNGRIYGKPIQNIIFGILGINSDSVDLKEVINSNHSEEMKKMDEICKKNKDISVNAATLCEYGGRFDSFEIEAQQRAEAISSIKKNSSLSDNEKAVQIAAVIGSSKDWNAGKTALFEKMAYAAQTLRGKPSTDVYGRNLFEAIYDFKKDESAFSGEAMDKSESYIQERLNGFIRNCGVAIECLKAHQMISEFTEEDIAAMDPDTQQTYYAIKTSTYDVRSKLKSIINIFTGDKDADREELKTGVLDTAGDYYNKSRRMYLRHENGTVSEVAISNNLYVQKSENYNEKDLKAHSALSRDEIINLQAHVNSTGMTMAEYLKAMDIDTSSMNVRKGPHAGQRTAYLSTLDSKCLDTANSRGRGSYYWYLKGIDMNKKGAGETTYNYHYKYVRSWIFQDNKDERYNSAIAVVLQRE